MIARTQRCVFACLLTAALAWSSASGEALRSCVPREPNHSAIGQCNSSCWKQLSNPNGSTNLSLVRTRIQLAADCAANCHNAYTLQMCYCRGPTCLDSLPCLTACGITGVYDDIASEQGSLHMCMRSTVHPDRTLTTRLYWMPRRDDVAALGRVRYYTVYYDRPELLHSPGFKVANTQLVRHYDVTSPYSFQVRSRVTDGRSNLLSRASPYNLIIYVSLIAYTMSDGAVHGVTNSFVNNFRPYFSSPECSRVEANLTRCADLEYGVAEPTEHYSRVVVTSFSTVTPPPSEVASSSSGKVPATARSVYGLPLNVSWSYELHEHRAAPANRTSADLNYAHFGCTPHSCWCWDSCAVRHYVSLLVTVGDVSWTTDLDVVVQDHDSYVHCPDLQANRMMTAEFPVSLLFRGAAEVDRVIDIADVSVSASIKSYYAVDTHFGPLRQAYNFTTVLKSARLSVPDAWPDAPSTSLGETSTPVAATNSTAPAPVTAVASGTVEIVVPIVIVVVIVLVFISILVIVRMWNYRKWKPQCVSRNNTLEKLTKIRVTSTFQNSTNASYESAARCTLLAGDWPSVPRQAINLESQLGSGQFGEVYMASVSRLNSREASTQVAVKVLKEGSTDKDERDFLEEAKHLRNFRHPNVIRLLGVCLDDNPKMILLELMDGGDLQSYLQSNQPGAARPAWDDAEYIDIALDITAGLRYLETEKYVHRDVAARNCLVSFNPQNSSLAVKPSSSGRIVKIADFGLARDIDRSDYYRIMDDKALVPVRWLAPESLQHKLFTGKSDVWSFGILLWEIFTYGQVPYGERTNVFDVYKFVTMGGMLDQPQFCPTAMYRLMKTTWASSPNDRPNFRQLHNHLSTFQKSLSRRKTLLTTLASFASVSGVADVDRSQLPHIPASQRVAVPPAVARASSAEGSVFADDDSDCAFGYSPYTSDLDNAFESPTDSPADSPVASRRAGPAFKPSPLVSGGGGGCTLPVPNGSVRQQRRQRRRSRSNSASREDINANGILPVKVCASGPLPIKSNGTTANGYAGRVTFVNGYVSQRDTQQQQQHDNPPILVTEFAPRKPLSPIVSASSVPDDSCFSSAAAAATTARRKSRADSSGSCVRSICTETSL